MALLKTSSTLDTRHTTAGEIAMNRCKSPVTIRHERGGSADTNLIRIDNSSNHGSNDDPVFEDEHEFYYPSSTLLSNGGSAELVEDSDGSKIRTAIEQVQSKIAKYKELLRNEQTARDDNVNEYLKLAQSAEKHQLSRLKGVFEKKNQKSAQSILNLQRKLESYDKRLRDLQLHGLHSHHRQPREVLRDMGQGLKNVGGNIRDGISGLSGSVMSKPREFAHYLIRNKFGSADNINSLSRNGENDSTEEEGRTHHGSATLPGGCSLASGGSAGALKFPIGPSDEGSECSSVTSESIPHPHSSSPHSNPPPAQTTNTSTPPPPHLEHVLAELRSQREEIDRLRNKIENVTEMVSKDIATLNHALQEERFKSERLEEQVNDLTELHQNEVENLKQTVSDMEEKVQYQSEERLRDIHEMLESCQTKISKMEHQQAQHQQYLTLEGLDNSNARAVVVKLINVLLTVLQVILLLVATIAGIIMPFLRTRLRVLSTIVALAAFVVVVKQWPEVRNITEFLATYFKQFLSVKQ
ncbi:transmembrane and coiled-coil domains protein 2 isoform X2 [Bemisia tabaci]|uniref:transmembrane and coiled-coil domains protein 2 isoform X2 n=1 Tax=Bemisia tabaci TaxID=7038 RepID=UPI0008F9E08A|nr:PREDICTED: transmembrane and coiled-coil domains protein 2 isoform X2 [Bemisia tabaci]